MIVLPPLRALLLALALGALCAFAVACGQEPEGLISAERAADIKVQLDNIDEDVQSERCTQALTDHLAALKREIDDLPGTVDADLRRTLRDGQEHLQEIAPQECSADTQTTRTTTTTETVPPATTETVPPPTTETVPTTPTQPQTTPTEPQPTTPTTPQTTEPPPTETLPGDSGGEEAPEGVIE